MFIAGLLFTTLLASPFSAYPEPQALCLNGPDRSTVESESDVARLFSEFGKVKKDVVKTKLDEFFTELMKDRTSLGVVMSYGEPKDVATYEKMFINHVKESGFDVTRITFVGAGKRKDAKFQLWVVPDGANFPDPEPGNKN
jgi:hypothetical protein